MKPEFPPTYNLTKVLLKLGIPQETVFWWLKNTHMWYQPELFFSNSFSLGDKKKNPVWVMQWIFEKKKEPTLPDFEEFILFLLKSSYLDNQVQSSHRNIAGFFNFSYFPLVDDPQCGYMEKLKEKNPDTRTIYFLWVVSISSFTHMNNGMPMLVLVKFEPGSWYKCCEFWL